MNALKCQCYRSARALGLFRLTRRLVRGRLLILCYHGFELEDEADFRPQLFMRTALFRERLETIRRHGFPVLPLDEALRRLDDGSLPPNSVCITIDDGSYSVLTEAAPLLKQYDMPATLYMTTYYTEQQVPIFRLAVQYLFWKTERSHLSLPELGDRPVALDDPQARESAQWRLIEWGESLDREAERQALCHQLGEALGVDYEAIARSRRLNQLNLDEVAQLRDYGIDVQLHTHRHRLPLDNAVACREEIRRNRASLEPVVGGPLRHFCYPSGIWHQSHWPCLEQEGMVSATTSVTGMNTRSTPRYRLFRILDKNTLPAIEFEAELFGFSEIVRTMTGKRWLADRQRGQVPDPRLHD